MNKEFAKWAVDLAMEAVADKPDVDVTVSIYEHSITISFYHKEDE